MPVIIENTAGINNNSAVTLGDITVSNANLPPNAASETTLNSLNSKVTTSSFGIQVDSSSVLRSSGDIIDVNNSTIVPLSANDTFTGTWTNVLNYIQITIIAYADQISTLQIQFSTDGVHVDHYHPYNIDIDTGSSVQVHPHAKYYRVVISNGAIAQSVLRFQAIICPMAGFGSITEANEDISEYDDCVLTKSILTGQSVIDGKYVNAKMTPDGGMLINQGAVDDALNSSTSNLVAGATYTGTAVSTLIYSGIKFAFKSDQNCTIYIDQSQDGTNYDITDTYKFLTAIGNFGISVQTVGSFYRIRVTNNGTSTSTYLRLQSILVPILNVAPRSLDLDGNFQVAIKSIADASGFNEYISPNGEQIAVPTYTLMGTSLNGGIVDSNVWTASTGTGGTASTIAGLMVLSTGTTANNVVSINSVAVARYSSEQPNKFRGNIRLRDTGTANNTRRWGMYTATDGAYFILSGSTFSIGSRAGSVDTLVSNGSLNGRYGNYYTIDTNAHLFEIILTSYALFYYVDKKLIHTINVTGTLATQNLNLPIRVENINSGGSNTNVTLDIRSLSVIKFGIPNNQPISQYIHGTGTTTIKSGPGNLHAVVMLDTGGTTITLYDNTSGSGKIIAVINPAQIGTLDFKGLQFSIGLTAVSVGNTVAATIIYD